MIGRGTIPEKILRELGSAETLETAFEVLMNTYLARGIEKGILAYGQAQSLAVMERFLEEVVVERECRLFRQDLLGLAVPLGFIWRKYCELSNLRMLARGTAYRMSSPAIRQELVLV
jgi:vacuolar-type H+-ATPase subunit C/Vma6